MEKENNDKRPGQPKKDAIIDRYSLRFRANYPHLKESLKSFMNVSKFTSLNDFIIEILNHYVDFHTSHENMEKIEKKFDKLIQNFNLKIKEFELKTKAKYPHPLEIISFKELVKNLYPNPIERTIFYLKFLEGSIYTEFELLYMLLTFTPFEFDNLSIKNYLDYYIEKNELTENDRKEIYRKIMGHFLNIWLLELNLYNVIKDREEFEVNSNDLEDFIFNIMYPDLETIPLFDENEYDKLQKEWERIIDLIDSELKDPCLHMNLLRIKQYIKFKLENVEEISFFVNSISKELRAENSLGLTRREFKKFLKQWATKEGLVNKEIQSLKEILKNIAPVVNDINDHDVLIKLIKDLDFPRDIDRFKKYEMFVSISKEINGIKQNFYKNIPKYKIKPMVTDSSLTKEEFIQHINRYYDFVLRDRHNEYSISSFPYYDFFFYPFILDKKILDLKGYYEYLKKNKVIIDFYPKEEDLRKELQI